MFLYKNHNINYPVGGEFGVFRCKNCGLIFLNPQPTTAELQSHPLPHTCGNEDAICHAEHPLHLLQQYYKLAKKGDTLELRVPNADSSAHRSFRKHWSLLGVPRHRYSFSRKNIVDYAKKAGFTVEHISLEKGRDDVAASVWLMVAAKLRKNIFLSKHTPFVERHVFRLLPMFSDSMMRVTLRKN